MFRLHFISAFRSLLKNKRISLINILGLTVGLTAFLFIIHYLLYEKSYDGFFKDSNRIYRINQTITHEGETISRSAITPRGMFFALHQFTDIESNSLAYFEPCLVTYKERGFNHQRVLWVDADFEKVFALDMLKGKADFIRPLTAVISASKAKNIFGNEDPIGKVLEINEGMPLEVTGVYADLPSNTHIEADYLFSIRTFVHFGWTSENGEWNYSAWWNYVKLKTGTDPLSIEQQLDKLGEINLPQLQADKRKVHFSLQPLTNLHFITGIENEFGARTNYKSLINLLIVGLLTLLVAWINFVNLSTAQAIKRTHEISLRKLIGARRFHLWIQSLSESFLISLSAVLTSYMLYKLLLIPFAQYFRIPFSSAYIPGGSIALFLMIACIAGIIFSSIYATFNIAGIKMSRQSDSRKPVKAGFKTSLVVVQLVISIVFICGTLLVFKQIRYMQNYKLGMDIERVISLNAPASTNSDTTRRARFTAFREELLQYPEIVSATATMNIPGQEPRFRGMDFMRTDAVSTTSNQFVLNNADNGLVPTFQLKLIEGRNFSPFADENRFKLLLNEKAAAILGFKSPSEAIGKIIRLRDNPDLQWEIIGVVADFHNEGLHKPIYPMVWNNDFPFEFGYFSVLTQTKNIPVTLSTMEKIWKKHYPRDPFDYLFASEFFNQQYQSEVRFGKFYILLTILSISISCLGLYGLLIFYLNQKRKEISIRKVNGARMNDILLFINQNFFRWGAIAFIIACPIVYYIMSHWLQNFAFRTIFSWWVYLASGLAVLLITLLTVSIQAYIAANKNPVEALRYE